MRDFRTEQHVVINDDRTITVPKDLRKIAVQFDHNVETVTFDCPRYWDGIDMSEMTVYVNYMRADRNRGMCLCKNVTVDEADDTLMHFTWTLTRNATLYNGKLIFLVCIKNLDENGHEINHWNSELCDQMQISEGLECEESVMELHQDIITDLLLRMDAMLAANTPILDQTLTMHGMAADAKHTGDAIKELRDATDDKIEILNKDLETKTSTIIKDFNNKTDGFSDALRTEAAQRAVEIDTERKRIDKLAKLKEGSTTGDAELQDTRIGFTGIEYDSAGESVRGQIGLAHEHIMSVAKRNPHNLFDPLYAIDRVAYISATGELISTPDYWVSNKMSVAGMTELYHNKKAYKYACFDVDGNYLPEASDAKVSTALDPIPIADGVAYISIQFASAATPFFDRFELVCCDFNHAYSGFERQYRIDPNTIDGKLKAVPGIICEDTNNLFDPLKACDNTAFGTADGIVHINNDLWSTHFIDVSSYSCVFTDRHPYKYGWFDENLAIIDTVGLEEMTPNFVQKFDRPENAKYLRIVYSKAEIPFEDRYDIVICSNESLFSVVGPRYNFGKNYSAFLDMLSVEPDNVFDPIQARDNTCFESASGGCFVNKLYWVTDFIPTNGITAFKSSKGAYKYGWYDADKKIIGTGGTAPEGAEFIVFQYMQSTIPFKDRFDLVICDATKEIDMVKPHYYISKTYEHSVRTKELKLLNDHKFRFSLTSATYMSDHTFIKGKLYAANASNDAHTDTNNVTVYTVDNETGIATYERSFKHNLGHCNSIDYCAGNDCLVLGNGSGDTTLPGEIYILPNPAERESWRYEDCVKINVSGENWGFKTNVVWGEHNNSQYNIIYVITNNNANVRKLLLTRGADGKFNGGYVLLDSWETKAIDVNQGSVYRNGKLYMAIGHAQVWLLEYELKPGGVMEIQEYKDIFYDESGTVLTDPFVEGITIENGYIYVGTWDGYIQVYKYWG